MVSSLLKRVPSSLYTASQSPATLRDAALRIRYLGTAGFVVDALDHTLVIDPFVTRPGLLTTIARRLQPDLDAIRRIVPRADDVLIGHAHHDHVLDGPDLCRMTGARFIGSRSACNVARAAGLPETQLVETAGREDIATGPGLARGLPSLHGRVYFGRIPLPGNIDSPPAWPPRFRALRHGLVLNWYIELGGVRVVHIDSADYIDEELEGLGADVLCLCAIGRNYRAGYVETAVAKLKPRFIIACHWDYFFTPYHVDPRCLPGVDLPGFVDEIRAAGSTPIVLPFDGVFGVS